MTRTWIVALALLFPFSPRVLAKESTTRVCVSVRLRTASAFDKVLKAHHPKRKHKHKATPKPQGQATSQPQGRPVDLTQPVALTQVHESEDPPSLPKRKGHVVDDHDQTQGLGDPPLRHSQRPHAGGSNTLLPLGQRPQDYLRRLIEYFVTHERHFEAVTKGCTERIDVDLYPLKKGWTVFARYSGHHREEWLSKLYPDELSQFAERVVLALLQDRPISTTIKRDTVLRADSIGRPRTIGGSNHIILSLGTQLRIGKLATAQADSSAEKAFRLFSPMTLSAGYRGRFQNWAISAKSHLAINASRTAIANNDAGGHVDFGGAFGASLHFLLYTEPRGVTSFYFGGGSTFEVLWYSVIKSKAMRMTDNRSSLVSGGLDVDLVIGYEFMRTSSVQFLLQAEVNLPAYAVNTENDDGGISGWFPGVAINLGVMF